MKHSFEEKHAAANHYQAGHAGIISTAKLVKISHTSLADWSKLVLLHG
ncbi:IS3 family transposase, partial [Escherichia coli]|nr:IS3 family transposase [Escherichia coli]